MLQLAVRQQGANTTVASLPQLSKVRQSLLQRAGRGRHHSDLSYPKVGRVGYSWLYVGHESQLRKPGDFLANYMGETPVIVARGDDGDESQGELRGKGDGASHGASG